MASWDSASGRPESTTKCWSVKENVKYLDTIDFFVYIVCCETAYVFLSPSTESSSEGSFARVSLSSREQDSTERESWTKCRMSSVKKFSHAPPGPTRSLSSCRKRTIRGWPRTGSYTRRRQPAGKADAKSRLTLYLQTAVATNPAKPPPIATTTENQPLTTAKKKSKKT